MPGVKSKYELKVECVITVPFYAQEPIDVKDIDDKKSWKEYWEARKQDEANRRFIMQYIRETLRQELSFIPLNSENDCCCSQKTRIRVNEGY